MLSCYKIKHVSSTCNQGTELDELFISLLHKENSSVPRTEPGGIPHLMGLKLD